jgi:16S rRNA C967 or C1407 C5-methylase (RsmB/RsmF family)
MELPVEFRKMLTEQFGDLSEEIIHAYQLPTSVSIRINPEKIHVPKELPCIPWCAEGLILNERPVFTSDPWLHGGAYYVQEASSMIVGEIVKKITDKIKVNAVLDCCASPGGKSTHIRSILQDDAVLLSNEFSRKRIPALAENLIKWGGMPGVVSNASLDKLAHCLAESFEVVVLDAPCSGEGLFRKQPEYLHSWKTGIDDQCAALQKDLIFDAWTMLKPGGYLIYSTCTLNKKENANIVGALLQQSDGIEQTSDFIDETMVYKDPQAGAYFLPGKKPGEAFYCCIIQKPGAAEDDHEKTFIKPQKTDMQPIEHTIISKFKNALFYIHSKSTHLIKALPDELIYLPGIPCYDTEHGEIPHHALCTWPHWQHNYIKLDLNHHQALTYLQRNALPISIQPGMVQLTFKGIALGWGKSVGSRINNLYPKSWKILNQRMDAEFTVANFTTSV